jgi:predicted flap endonuclease-1-like 5' DNA nuclease
VTTPLDGEVEAEQEEAVQSEFSAEEALEAQIPAGIVDAETEEAAPAEFSAEEALEAQVPAGLAGTEEEGEEIDPSDFSAEQALEEEVAEGDVPPDDLDVPLPGANAGPSDDPPQTTEEATADLSVELRAAVKSTESGGVIVFPSQDLTRIKGIGPKIEKILNQVGIVNYEQLAGTPASRLEEILDAAGPRYRMAHPGAWPQEARLAATEKWDELDALQERVSETEIAPPVLEEAQDLTRIEGVDATIAEMLNKARIVNYGQLAETPVSRLVDILDAAGPQYRMANPSTWPQQARLAAEEKWDELSTFQRRLAGG